VKILLAIASAGELLTGLLLVACPSTLASWLLGAELIGAGAMVARVAGLALVALGFACWPRAGSTGARVGMLFYSTAVAIYLAYLAITGAATGHLLWPAVAGHLVLSALLVWLWTMDSRKRGAIT
jgi:hypothetical protein